MSIQNPSESQKSAPVPASSIPLVPITTAPVGAPDAIGPVANATPPQQQVKRGRGRPAVRPQTPELKALSEKRRALRALRRERVLAKEQEQRYLRQKNSEKLIVKYKPHPAQQKLREELDSGKRIVLYVGGIRGGKTFAGARETLYSIYKRGYNKRGLTWLVSPTFPMAGIVEKEFEQACDLGGNRSLILKKYVGSHSYLLVPPKGSDRPYRVEVKTAEHPDRLRGSSLDFIWMDEAAMMDPEAYTILLGRVLDSKGTILMTTTPRGMNWLYHEVHQQLGQDPRMAEVSSTTSENPYLDPIDIEHLRRKYSEQFAKQELGAQFVAFEGLVYEKFVPSMIIDPVTTFPEGGEVLGGVDAGYSDPFVHLWIIKHKNKYYVVDEHYQAKQTMEQHAGAIERGYLNKKLIRRWMDPSAAQASADLASLGINSFPAKNDIQAGINAVSRCIEEGRLFISRNCVRTLGEIGMYSYPDKGSKNKGEVPVDAWNHAMDALRYVIYAEEGYGKHQPFLTLGLDGKMRLEGTDEPDPRSNKLEDWVKMRGYNEFTEIDDNGEY